MALFDRAVGSGALEDLLMRERTAILAGQFDVLERLATEKQRLVGLVAQQNADGESLSRLRHLAERNGKLLAAMDRGIKAATRRIEVLRKGPGTLQTYNASGQRQTITATDHSLLRRA